MECADSAQTVGEHCVKVIASALWYLDPHHAQFKDRSCEITGAFADYNNWKRKKEKRPQISFVELDSLSPVSCLNLGVINLLLNITS